MLFRRLFHPTLIILLMGVLASCSGGATPEANLPPTAVATSTTQPSATATTSPTVTPVPTSTLVPTETPVPPTETPIPPTETPIPPTETPVPPTETPIPPTETPIPPTAVPAPPASASGRMLPRSGLNARPWIVMIDNHPGAYPQSGLDKAAVVIEGLAEFGITRFMATFADGITPNATEIGPIRSTRLYFAQLAMGFHPVYGHAGGSPDGEELVRTTRELVNFDADGQTAYSYRDRQRQAPHNLYTSSKLLRTFADDKGVAAFSDDSVGYLYSNTSLEGAAASRIDYYFGDRSSAAAWVWSAPDGIYYRGQRGKPHIDRITGAQVTVSNVVVMEVSGGKRAGDDKGRIDQDVIGSGRARFFRNGSVLPVTWVKEGAASPLRFYDASNAEVRFAPGAIWIAAIPSLERMTINGA